MNKYVEFLESHLGSIVHGYTDDGENLPFHVVKFKGGPFPNTVTYSTLGLSHHNLVKRNSEKTIKHELFIVADSGFDEKEIVGALKRLGKEVLETHRPYLRGQVIGPRGTLFRGTKLEALYASVPVYFPDSFFEFEVENENSSIAQVWLVPVTAREAAFVAQNGWSLFEDLLTEADPDLINFKRDSIV
jgi:hypothetical protein